MDELKGKLGDEVPVLMPELDARIHAGEKVVEGKLTGQLAEAGDGARRAPGGRRHAWAASRSSPAPATRPATSPSSTRATAPSSPATCSPRSATTAVSNHFYWRFPLAAMATFDKAEDLASARALRALDPALLVVGHGSAVSAPTAAMDAAIARAAR